MSKISIVLVFAMMVCCAMSLRCKDEFAGEKGGCTYCAKSEGTPVCAKETNKSMEELMTQLENPDSMGEMIGTVRQLSGLMCSMMCDESGCTSMPSTGGECCTTDMCNA